MIDLRAFTILPVILLSGCGPDLPAGWENAERVDELVQAECSDSPYQGYTVTIAAEKVGADALRVLYSNAHFRCAQDVEAFWKTDAAGVSILVQPKDMHPDMVAGCDCLYDVTMSLPREQESGSVSVFRRWDALNEPNDPIAVGSATF